MKQVPDAVLKIKAPGSVLDETTANRLLRDLDVIHQAAQIRWKDWTPEQMNALMINVKELVRRYCDI